VTTRKPADAAKAFQRPIQLAFGCFLDGRVQVTTYDVGKPGTLMLNSGRPTALKGAGSLSISSTIHYRIVEVETPAGGSVPKVTTDGWIHTLFAGDDEILGYHWHPADTPDVQHPHFHYERGREHFPTGRILVEDVLQAAVELGALPRDATKWVEVRDANRAAFLVDATWGTGPTFP
jgi:hypothetical protein